MEGIDEVKREVEQVKLENGESQEEVGEWGKGIEVKIDAADDEIKLLETRVERMIAEMKEIELARQREEQLKLEKQQLEQSIRKQKKPSRVNRALSYRNL